jgi:tetratricopeptide (TPR) repeat protein
VTEDILLRLIDSVQSNPDTSENALLRAKRYEQDLADMRMLKGKIRLKQNRPVDALHELRLALPSSAQPSEVYLDIGLANISLGEFDVAKSAFKHALRLDSLSKGALFNMGNLYYAQKDYDSAYVYYKQTSERFPEFKYPLLYLGNIETFRENFKKAIAYYSEYIALDSTSEEAYFRRAVLFSEIRDWNRAITDWNMALQLNENNSEAWRNRGLAYFQQMDYEKALKDFNQSITLKPEPYTYMNRGYTHYLLNNFTQALEDLNLGLKDLPDYQLGYYFRALTKLSLKDKTGACEDLKIALEKGMTEDEVTDKKLRRLCL